MKPDKGVGFVILNSLDSAKIFDILNDKTKFRF